MADRNLTVVDLIKLYKHHGCDAGINDKNFVKVVRKIESSQVHWSQHAHKGKKDKFDRRVVAASRRRLLFQNMPDAQFYEPVN